MGWGAKRKEGVTPQPVRESRMAEMEVVDEMPSREPEPVAQRRGAQESVPAASIGATLRLQGELTGHEDVTIDGSVEGSIEVLEHTLTIGPSASIKASIRARCVVIEGQVVGDVTADDKVEITATGSLVGDIRAGRVVLAENARFKGSVDMGWSESSAAANDAPEPFDFVEKPAPRKPVKQERSAPTPPPRPAASPTPAPAAAAQSAPSASTNKLSALDWDEPAPTPPSQSDAKD